MEDKEFWRNERVAFLALTTVKGVGFWSLHKIAQSNFGFKKVLREPESSGIEKLLIGADYSGETGQESLWAEGISLARALTATGIRLIFKNEPDFPARLKEIPDAPEWIFIQGKPENLKKPAVTVVGTRKPTDDGLFLTKYILATLSNLDCVTVSGLALGIDQTAHTESIRYGLPTIAVLGTGALQNYPRGSEGLRNEILNSGGTIITEYLPHQSYSAETFVRRNRLQAALGDVLVPAEWSIKSGTAHTVKFAAKYHKTIINLFLPKTLENRTEIPFSAAEYGASWFEVPAKADSLTRLLKAKLLGEAQSEDCSASEDQEAHSNDADSTTDIDLDKSSQLSLI